MNASAQTDDGPPWPGEESTAASFDAYVATLPGYVPPAPRACPECKTGAWETLNYDWLTWWNVRQTGPCCSWFAATRALGVQLYLNCALGYGTGDVETAAFCAKLLRIGTPPHDPYVPPPVEERYSWVQIAPLAASVERIMYAPSTDPATWQPFLLSPQFLFECMPGTWSERCGEADVRDVFDGLIVIGASLWDLDPPGIYDWDLRDACLDDLDSRCGGAASPPCQYGCARYHAWTANHNANCSLLDYDRDGVSDAAGNPVVRIAGSGNVFSASFDDIPAILDAGKVVTATGYFEGFADFEGGDGIFECDPGCASGRLTCPKNHAVVIVGYEQHGRVLLIANSWARPSPDGVERIWASEADACHFGRRNLVIGDIIVRDASASPHLATDTDGDGFPFLYDLCPYEWNPPEERFVNSDGDEWPDACDRCRNPGTGSGYESYRWDFSANADPDGDGIGWACDANPVDASVTAYAQPLANRDCDEYWGDFDACPHFGNWERADRDGDGRWDYCDACPDDAWNADEGLFEHIFAGTGSVVDDADHVTFACDNCPRTANTGQADSDADGTGAACDLCDNDADVRYDPLDYWYETYLGDDDDDRRPTSCAGETLDNCPNDANPYQDDYDDDGLGDLCDGCPGGSRSPGRDETYSHAGGYLAGDVDSDFVFDWCDVCPYDGRSWSAGMYDGDPDRDTDTWPDGCDNCPGDANVDQGNCNATWESLRGLPAIGDACDPDLCVAACEPRDLGGSSPSLLYGGTPRGGALNMRDGAPAGLDLCYLGGTTTAYGVVPRYNRPAWLQSCDCLDATDDEDCEAARCSGGLARPGLAGSNWQPMDWEDSLAQRAAPVGYAEFGGAVLPEKRLGSYRPLYYGWPSSGRSYANREDWLQYTADELDWHWTDDHDILGAGGEVSVRLWFKPDDNMDDAWRGDLYWSMTRLRWSTAAEDHLWDDIDEWGRPPEGPIELPRPDDAGDMRGGWNGGWYEVPDLIGPGCPWCEGYFFPRPGEFVKGMWVIAYRPNGPGFAAEPRPVTLVDRQAPDRQGMTASIVRNRDGTILRAAFFGGRAPDGTLPDGLWELTAVEGQTGFELRRLDGFAMNRGAPIGRIGASLVYRPDDSVLLLGGESDDGLLETAWIFEPGPAAWRRANIGGLPAAWSDVAAAELAGHLYGFGGKSGSGVHAGFYRLDLRRLRMETLGDGSVPSVASSGPFGVTGGSELLAPAWPAPRSAGRMAANAKDRELWLYGGFDGQGRPRNDLWAYSLDTGTWRQVRKQCDGPGCPTFRRADLLLATGRSEERVVLPDPTGPDGNVGAWFDSPAGWIPAAQVAGSAGWNDCNDDGTVEANVGLRCGGGLNGWPDAGRWGCAAGEPGGTACRFGGAAEQAATALSLPTTKAQALEGERLFVGTPAGVEAYDAGAPGTLSPAWTAATRTAPRDTAVARGYVLVATTFGIDVFDERTGERLGEVPTCGVPRRIVVAGDRALALGLQSATLLDLSAAGGPSVLAREQYWHLGSGSWRVTRSRWLCLAAAARDLVCSLFSTCREQRFRTAADATGSYVVTEMDGDLLAFSVDRSGISSLAILPSVGELAGLRAEGADWYGVGWDGSNPTFRMPGGGMLARQASHDVPEWVLAVRDGVGLRTHVRSDGLDARWYEVE